MIKQTLFLSGLSISMELSWIYCSRASFPRVWNQENCNLEVSIYQQFFFSLYFISSLEFLCKWYLSCIEQNFTVPRMNPNTIYPDWQTNTKTTEDFEWSSDQIVTLLEFYSQYPQLWDTKHERYMNKDVRKQLISQLSELLLRFCWRNHVYF